MREDETGNTYLQPSYIGYGWICQIKIPGILLLGALPLGGVSESMSAGPLSGWWSGWSNPSLLPLPHNSGGSLGESRVFAGPRKDMGSIVCD